MSRFPLVLAAVLASGAAACAPVNGPGAGATRPEPSPSGGGAGAAGITSYEECIEAGYPMLKSYPPQCRVPGGPSFTQDLGNAPAKRDLIQVETPRPGERVGSPLVVKGQARGPWFFEADFPVILRDGGGTQIAQGIARAEGEWMTEEFVPFTATLEFEPPPAGRGTLVLEKSNPSGLTEHADELRVPVRFPGR